MTKKKQKKIVIINRSFWPLYPVIGDALLTLSEELENGGNSVSIIMQGNSEFKSNLKANKRGKNVKFFRIKAITASSSSITSRVLEAILFLFWVILILIWVRPEKIYVSSDPPVIVPFAVMVFSCFSKSKYVYHLQDIHPEATNIVKKLNQFIFNILLMMDRLSLQHAEQIVTITETMAKEIQERSKPKGPIHILGNPSSSFKNIKKLSFKKNGFVFCGNAGRLQRIPLLLNSIRAYLLNGGQFKFVFAGGGIYSTKLEELSREFKLFEYLGPISQLEAAQLNADYKWAILPIEDEVTRYSFPSKTSSYLTAGANIIAICGKQTNVAKWVCENRLGIVVEPDVKKLMEAFFLIEKRSGVFFGVNMDRDKLASNYSIENFVDRLAKIISK